MRCGYVAWASEVFCFSKSFIGLEERKDLILLSSKLLIERILSLRIPLCRTIRNFSCSGQENQVKSEFWQCPIHVKSLFRSVVVFVVEVETETSVKSKGSGKAGK